MPPRSKPTANDRQQWAEQRQHKLAELHTQLVDQVATLTDATAWRTWLTFASRFHNYSFNNLILIQGLNSGDLINSSGGSSYFSTPYAIRNNILRSTRAASVVATGPGITYSNNLFFGVPAVGSASQSGFNARIERYLEATDVRLLLDG